MLDVRKRT